IDAALQKALLDRVYDKRKAATLDLERQVREALAKNDRARINVFVEQLTSLLNSNLPSSSSSSSNSPQSVNARNGALIGLAGVAIALGIEIAPYLQTIVPPILVCFADPDSKIRYFACESFYNIAKVCKGEILMYFNETFDALSRLAADSELSVKNGAELLDRLLKDIVCEAAPHYVSQYQDTALIRARQDSSEGNLGGAAELDVAREKAHHHSHRHDAVRDGRHEIDEDGAGDGGGDKVFSLARFVPLLAERMYVLSPFTRNYLVSWVTVLDSVPDLELVSFLPSFLDGLLKYLSDPNTDVRVATANVLADFLREIREAAEVARIRGEAEARRAQKEKEKQAQSQERVAAVDEGAEEEKREADGEEGPKEGAEEHEEKDEALEEGDEDWMPAPEVRIDYAAIMEILINHITYPDEEIQATTLQWIAELLVVIKDVVVPFVPRLIPAILPSLAHHSPAIQTAANVTNANLYQVVQSLSWATSASLSSQPEAEPIPLAKQKERAPLSQGVASPRVRSSSNADDVEPITGALGISIDGTGEAGAGLGGEVAPNDPFDLQTTVNVLTLQLIDEHEETRVTALEWLLMLHQKAPRRILSIDDGTFPALLKTLSDPSEEVIKCDLRLLAQMSGASDEAYNSYLANLVSLFSTDRRLLEARGSLIIRQLCTSLHTERVFRTLAEILERDEDLEFASIMVTNLSMILITSPELSDFRKRLKNLDSKDGSQLFNSLYRSWCHNAVATFSLCLLAQAYEHAANLLPIFAELEMTVGLLIQIDKLVQLLESPIFTALRLQLLEPDRHPFLFKCLYGILMLLPQSSAFATLRNRLNAVNGLGYLNVVPRATSASVSSSSSASSAAATAASKSRVGSGKDDIKWAELLTHFRAVQARHERSRRVAHSASS
ncbi:ARM repeat-containing protein, partial [Acaromyces ingoldii]